MTYVRSFEDFKPPKRFDSVPFEQVTVQESSAQAGPWTDLDTINLTPLDVDPSAPAARDISISSATLDPGWYRLEWIDANGAIFVADPIFSEHVDLDRIRVMIGDTDPDDQLLSDSEVGIEIANWPDNRVLAAANCAQAIAGKFARGYNVQTDGQVFNRSERVNHYTELAATLRTQGALTAMPPGTVSATLGTAVPSLYGTA